MKNLKRLLKKFATTKVCGLYVPSIIIMVVILGAGVYCTRIKDDVPKEVSSVIDELEIVTTAATTTSITTTNSTTTTTTTTTTKATTTAETTTITTTEEIVYEEEDYIQTEVIEYEQNSPSSYGFVGKYYCGSEGTYGASGRTLISGYSVASSYYPLGTLLYIESDGLIPNGTYSVDDTGCPSDVIDFFYHYGQVPSDFEYMGVSYLNVWVVE